MSRTCLAWMALCTYHEPTIFCSSFVMIKQMWLHPEELKFIAKKKKKKKCCINVDKHPMKQLQMEIFACCQADLYLHLGSHLKLQFWHKIQHNESEQSLILTFKLLFWLKSMSQWTISHPWTQKRHAENSFWNVDLQNRLSVTSQSLFSSELMPYNIHGLKEQADW